MNPADVVGELVEVEARDGRRERGIVAVVTDRDLYLWVPGPGEELVGISLRAVRAIRPVHREPEPPAMALLMGGAGPCPATA
jgi:hypothetical protein